MSAAAHVVDVVFYGIFFAFCGYQWGKIRGWSAGYSDGYANGRQLGRVEGNIECLRSSKKKVDEGAL